MNDNFAPKIDFCETLSRRARENVARKMERVFPKTKEGLKLVFSNPHPPKKIEEDIPDDAA